MYIVYINIYTYIYTYVYILYIYIWPSARWPVDLSAKKLRAEYFIAWKAHKSLVTIREWNAMKSWSQTELELIDTLNITLLSFSLSFSLSLSRLEINIISRLTWIARYQIKELTEKRVAFILYLKTILFENII